MKDKFLQIRISDELRDEIREEAEKHNMSMSAYLLSLYEKERSL
jgi:hypothetical protein